MFEHQLIKEDREFEAGTDHPFFYDAKDGREHEAHWNTDFGYPFGYWRNGNNVYEFSIGDAWATHSQACGKLAKKFFYEVRYNTLLDDFQTFIDDIDDLMYNYDADDLSSMDLRQWVNEHNDSPLSTNEALEMVTNSIENGETPSAEELADERATEEVHSYDFEHEKGIDNALKNIGYNFTEYFEEGYSEGRIWPMKKMIGFYDTEQPEPDHFRGIINELVSANIDTLNNILDYYIIFQDGYNDWNVTGCTVYDYIQGNYGYDDEEEDDEEREIQYAKPEKTRFVPHLADQSQKREFFKKFRDTRDKAVYAPREQGAGSLAAYHAMRYPYGESKKRKKNTIV